jgi:asparagine synthase (glutamine-hydrolysing)
MVDACRLHMRADVPVGVMLSGGLDSAALLASLDLAGVLSPDVKCFSVDFGPDLTERPWIESAARHHGLPWEIDSYSPDDFAATIRPMMWHQEAPIGGLMNCALNSVMKAARGQGYSVLQAGAGPDEAFGGYRNHHNLYLGLALQSGSPDVEQRLAEYARNWGVSPAAARRAAEMEISRSHTAIDGTVAVRPEALSYAVNTAPLLPAADLGTIGDPLRESQLHYLQGSKIPRNTRMLDRLSMAYGIEIRLPFLDHRLVELGFGLSPNLYFLEGRSKGIIRSALKGAMDDDVRLATKRSIQAPQGPWLRREPMASYIDSLIGSESFASRNLFDVAVCKALFARFKAGEFDNSFFVWQWINVEEWFRTFIDSDLTGKIAISGS